MAYTDYNPIYDGDRLVSVCCTEQCLSWKMEDDGYTIQVIIQVIKISRPFHVASSGGQLWN